MIADSPKLKSQMVAVSRALHRMGWVANHDGNVTARLGADRFLATPTSVSKADVDESMLIVVSADGKVISGRYRPFSELVLHRAAYEAREDVQAVVHAHPPVATAFAVAGRGLDRPIIAEAVVSLGPRVPLAPFALPGTPEFIAPVRALLETYDAILLGNHGVLTVGVDLEQAYLRMELVEHLARIEWTSEQIGGPQYLDDSAIPPLLDKRAKAGLGPRARGLPDVSAEASPRSDADSLRRIVAEEIRALFGREGR